MALYVIDPNPPKKEADDKMIILPDYDRINICIRTNAYDRTYCRQEVEKELADAGKDLGEVDWMCYIVERELSMLEGFSEEILSMIVDPHIEQATFTIGNLRVLITKDSDQIFY